jgi:hypothetical protein
MALTKRQWPLVRLTLLAASLAAVAVYHARGLLHHDPSFLLVATDRWLRGATLYRDIVEINPPWIFYLTAPSVIAARLFAISPSTAFIVFVIVATGVSLIWCWSLLRRIPALSSPARYAIIAACFAALLVVPGYNFGQREQLFLLFALPYFLATGFDPLGLRPGTSEKVALGLFAALGIALKPYFFAPVILVAAVQCCRRRSFWPLLGPTNLSIVGALLAYGALVALRHPDYLGTIVPLGLNVYGTIADDAPNIPARSVLPLLLIAIVATLRQPAKELRDSELAFSAILFGLWLAFALQRKSWEYQILPFDGMAVVVAVIVIAASGRAILSRPARFAILATAPVFLLASVLAEGPYANPYPGAFLDSLQKIGPDWKGKTFIVLTTNVSAAFPFINEIGADWVGKYPYQWLIAGARTRRSELDCQARKGACEELDAILGFARQTNVDDFAEHPPEVVLIDGRALKPYMPDEPFDYLAFLGRDPRFAKIWQGYTKIDTVEGYEIWLRSRDSAADQAKPNG